MVLWQPEHLGKSLQGMPVRMQNKMPSTVNLRLCLL